MMQLLIFTIPASWFCGYNTYFYPSYGNDLNFVQLHISVVWE